MAKNLQLYTLYQTMEAAGSKGVTKQQVSKLLNISEKSVPVYMFGLKKYFKSDYEAIKNGRQVVAYKLVKTGKENIWQHRKGTKVTTKKVIAAKPAKMTKVKSNSFDVPTLDQDIDASHISDREFSDIKSSLGLL